MLAMGYVVAALFFLRFWSRTKDTLFAYFGAAFGILAVQRVALVIIPGPLEDTTWLYVLRLLAFVLILIGIAVKNRRG
jgi:hypothetical protein